MSDKPVRASRVREFADLARKQHAERIAAELTVEPLLRRTPLPEWPRLAHHSDLQTSGALTKLGRIASEANARDPQYALAVAQLAVAIAESIPVNAYPAIVGAQLRGHAWKDLGKSLRILSRYEEAHGALLKAECEIRSFPILGHDLAIVQVNLAVLLQETNRLDEAAELLTVCKSVFKEHGDTEAFVQSALIEGAGLQRQRRYTEARDSYRLLLDSTNHLSLENEAALIHALGLCSIELEEFDDADNYLIRAASIHRNLGHLINALKTELGRGRLFLRRGQYDQVVSHLRPVRREFLRNSLPEEAGLCGLDIVAALLILNRPGEAEQLARKIVHEFTVAKLNSRAILALSHLSDAITANNASLEMALDTREYILSLRSHPERELSTGPSDG